jgi:hypothetical protein
VAVGPGVGVVVDGALVGVGCGAVGLAVRAPGVGLSVENAVGGGAQAVAVRFAASIPFAVLSTHALPQRASYDKPSNVNLASSTFDTSQKLVLVYTPKELARANVASMVLTLETSHPLRSRWNAAAILNTLCSTDDTTHKIKVLS